MQYISETKFGALPPIRVGFVLSVRYILLELEGDSLREYFFKMLPPSHLVYKGNRALPHDWKELQSFQHWFKPWFQQQAPRCPWNMLAHGSFTGGGKAKQLYRWQHTFLAAVLQELWQNQNHFYNAKNRQWEPPGHNVHTPSHYVQGYCTKRCNEVERFPQEI